MAHKIEIANLLQDSLNIDPSLREIRNTFHSVVEKLDQLHLFIDTACADCADNNDIIIKRTALEERINSVNTALIAAQEKAVNASYLSLSDYWPVDIDDTSGLTNPTTETTETSGSE